ncbi:hypothetical protein BD770DRAFT_395320 [Pilaira anomala]|nr:hypothetical protein BD770DRAFT_395320 [Pilaira anomala]
MSQTKQIYPGEPLPSTDPDKRQKMAKKKLEMEASWDEASKLDRLKLKETQDKLIETMARLNLLQEKNKALEVEKRIADEKRKQADDWAKKLQEQHYDRTRNIKVTDDDFSTIIAKLGKFSGKLSNFSPNSKSFFKKDLPRDQLIHFFINNNQEHKDQILFLFQQDTRVDYALVSVLVEKLITKEIVHHIYRAAIHLDLQVNNAFETIQNLLISTQHEAWISDFRLKIAKATHDLIHRYDHDGKAKAVNDLTRNRVIDTIVSQLSIIYNNENEIRSRIEKLVDMAIDLSLPIRGQEDLVEIIDLKPEDNVYKNQVKPMYRQLEGNKIKLGIFPVFLAKSTLEDENQSENEEEDNNITPSYLPGYTLVYPGKAIY